MSSRKTLIRDEPKISLWASGDTLQVAGWVVGAPGLGSDRRMHVLRHHLHHPFSYSVAEEQRCVRLLQHCIIRGVLAVLRAACACQWSMPPTGACVGGRSLGFQRGRGTMSAARRHGR